MSTKAPTDAMAFPSRNFWIGALLAVAMTAGCRTIHDTPTELKKREFMSSFGYKDQKLNASTHQITAEVNYETAGDIALKYAVRRAADVAHEKGHARFAVVGISGVHFDLHSSENYEPVNLGYDGARWTIKIFSTRQRGG